MKKRFPYFYTAMGAVMLLVVFLTALQYFSWAKALIITVAAALLMAAVVAVRIIVFARKFDNEGRKGWE